jgi:V/A-type H+-transporting ATPase subunit E
MSKLEEILREEVAAEIDEILAEADAESAGIVGGAEKEATARLAFHRKKAEAEARIASGRARSAADLEISTARMQARGEVMGLVREKAMTVIEDLASRSNYGEVIRSLAREAAQMMGDAEAVVVNPGDREMLRDWAVQRGIELRTDPEVRLGVRIVGRSGRAVENTLPERLRRAWEMLASEVTKLLWE